MGRPYLGDWLVVTHTKRPRPCRGSQLPSRVAVRSQTVISVLARCHSINQGSREKVDAAQRDQQAKNRRVIDPGRMRIDIYHQHWQARLRRGWARESAPPTELKQHWAAMFVHQYGVVHWSWGFHLFTGSNGYYSHHHLYFFNYYYFCYYYYYHNLDSSCW